MVYTTAQAKAATKGHALESERSGGATEGVCGGVCLRRVDDDGVVPGVWDHATDRISFVAALRRSRRRRTGRSEPGGAPASEPDAGGDRSGSAASAAGTSAVGTTDVA